MVAETEKNNQSDSSQSSFREVFRILGEPARFLRANLFVIWIAILFLFWFFTPIQGIPYPSEVLTAFTRMFASEANDSSNIVYNTWATLKLNIVGLFFASMLALIIAYFSVVPFLQPLNQILQWFRYLPIVAFNLVFLSIFTIGWSMKVAMLSALEREGCKVKLL